MRLEQVRRQIPEPTFPNEALGEAMALVGKASLDQRQYVDLRTFQRTRLQDLRPTGR